MHVLESLVEDVVWQSACLWHAKFFDGCTVNCVWQDMPCSQSLSVFRLDLEIMYFASWRKAKDMTGAWETLNQHVKSWEA
jgi:hypothetical protein